MIIVAQKQTSHDRGLSSSFLQMLLHCTGEVDPKIPQHFIPTRVNKESDLHKLCFWSGIVKSLFDYASLQSKYSVTFRSARVTQSMHERDVWSRLWREGWVEADRLFRFVLWTTFHLSFTIISVSFANVYLFAFFLLVFTYFILEIVIVSNLYSSPPLKVNMWHPVLPLPQILLLLRYADMRTVTSSSKHC